MGSVVGFLTAGLIIGQIRDLPSESVGLLREFAEIGVVLLLFVIGIEIKPPQLRDLGRDAVKLGAPQIALSAGIIGLYTWRTFAAWDEAIVLGLALSLSSTIVVLQLLGERHELHSPWGKRAFAVLLAQDLAVVPFLLAVSLMGKHGVAEGSPSDWVWLVVRASLVVFAIIVVGRFVLTRILSVAVKQQNEPAFVCVTFLAVLSAALASREVGLSMALGTFLLGATLSASPFGHRIAVAVEPVKSTLLALFFLSVGLSVSLDVVGAYWPQLLFHTVVILALKFAIILGLALILGILPVEALRLSLALAQCGEFGFVLFSAAQAGGLMRSELSALASILVAISMLATPFLVRLGARPQPARSLSD